MFLFMLLIIQPVHLEFVFPKLTKQGSCSHGSQILGFRDSSDFRLSRSIQAFEYLDVKFVPFKVLAKVDEMVYNVSEFVLYISNGLPFEHSEHLILLN